MNNTYVESQGCLNVGQQQVGARKWLGLSSAVAILGCLGSAGMSAQAATDLYISLKSHHNTYFVSENNGGPGQTVNSNRSAIGPWERFTLSPVSAECPKHNDLVTIESDNNYFWTARSDGKLMVDRRDLGSREQFTVINHTNQTRCVENNDVISLRSVDNKYVVAEQYGRANANRSEIGAWERMQVVVHSTDSDDCDALVKGWTGSYYTGTKYSWGPGCAPVIGTPPIRSLKVKRDHVARLAWTNSSNRESMIRAYIGNKQNIGTAQQLSFYEAPYRRHTTLSLKVFFDQDMRSSQRAEMINKARLVESFLRTSGVNVSVDLSSYRFNWWDTLHLRSKNIFIQPENMFFGFRDLVANSKKSSKQLAMYVPKYPGLAFTDFGGVWGLGATPDTFDKTEYLDFIKNQGISVVRPKAPAFVFAHEVGHNLGLLHGDDASVNSLRVYGRGYLAPDEQTGSIMQSSNLNWETAPPGVFSNIWMTCTPGGVICGEADRADSVRAMTETAVEWLR